jgi:ParB family chromosome partitioning protein
MIRIPLEFIDPDPAQARDEGADDELADSIKANGVLQPIRVYRHPAPHGIVQWMIDDGERRWRGSRKAGLADIPAREVDPPDRRG